MRTRKGAAYQGPRDKHPGRGRKPRTRQPSNEVRFGKRTTEGDVFLPTESETVMLAAFKLQDDKLRKQELQARIAQYAAVMEHWSSGQ